MSLSGQLINVLAAVMLLIAFAMLSQRRILSLIELFAWQGVVLAASTFIVAGPTSVDGFVGDVNFNPIDGIRRTFGQVTVVPAPAALPAVAAALLALALRRPRHRIDMRCSTSRPPRAPRA